MLSASQIESLPAEQLREVTRGLIGEIQERDAQAEAMRSEILFKSTRIDQLTYELARYKRARFDRTSEKLDRTQASLLEEALDEDLCAIEEELERLEPTPPVKREKSRPRREPLPVNLPRVEFSHEPESTICACGCQMKRIGEDVAEKLFYAPGDFSVERHIRGKWVCGKCERLVQAPVAPQIIDKGIATPSLLAQVMVAKYADHLPLYRQEEIFGRAGYPIPRSTLGEWVGVCGVRLQPLVDTLRGTVLSHRVLHADETPVAMLKPGAGKAHRAYLWAYSPGAFEDVKAVVYDFTETRSGKNAQQFLGEWRGALVCDDYSGYKALLAKDGVTECGCLAHARRKFFDLHEANKSQIAADALALFGQLYDVEREVKDLDATTRRQIRQAKAKPVADTLHAWMLAHRLKVPDGTATAKALNYSINRWRALTRYLDDGTLPADNNYIENRIRPIALGRSNWLFAGSLRAGQRAAAIMSLIQSAKMNGHDPFAYLQDVFARLPTLPASRIEELLPHRWIPTTN
jgi:transposase